MNHRPSLFASKRCEKIFSDLKSLRRDINEKHQPNDIFVVTFHSLRLCLKNSEENAASR